MEPKIEPWIKDAVDQIHSETESASCDGYCESRKTALMKIIAQHAPSSPAAPDEFLRDPTPHMSAAEFYREVWIKENGSDPRGDWPIRMAEAFAAYETARAAPDAAAPSPCCANPKMVVKGLCDLDPDSVYLHTKEAYARACLNWRPTHNVCLNCGKEEKL